MASIPRSISSPKQFIIGAQVLEQLSDIMCNFGNNALLICDPFIVERIDLTVVPAIQSADMQATTTLFKGECTDKEISRLQDVALGVSANVIIGIGGGKTLDVAKAVAHFLHIPVLICPTIASTDAPCTALSVIYKDNGEFDRYLFLPQNPDAVIADTSIIAQAPVRFFAAGVGDALATYFEARACYQANGLNLINKKPSRTGLGLSQLCYELIAENIELAMDAVSNHVVTPALEEIIEATIYLSGVGAESGGLAAAHAVNNAMSIVDDLHHVQHGEKVVFGLMTQLVLEHAPLDEIEGVIHIIKTAGLPLTLGQMGLKTFDESVWREVATLACADGDTMINMPRSVSPEEVYQAMVAANYMGERYL
jgi:glycerol dehydrogenase